MSVTTGSSREGENGKTGLDELCVNIDRATLIAALQKLQPPSEGSHPNPGKINKSGSAKHSTDGGSASEVRGGRLQ